MPRFHVFPTNGRDAYTPAYVFFRRRAWKRPFRRPLIAMNGHHIWDHIFGSVSSRCVLLCTDIMIQIVTAVRGTASSTYRAKVGTDPVLISVTFIPKTAAEKDAGRKTIVRYEICFIALLSRAAVSVKALACWLSTILTVANTKFITFFSRLFCISRTISNLAISERSVSHSRLRSFVSDAATSWSIAGLGVSLMN